MDRFGLAWDLGTAQQWFVTNVSNHLRGDGAYALAPGATAIGLASHVGLKYIPETTLTRMVNQNYDRSPEFTRYLPTSFSSVLPAIEYLYAAFAPAPDLQARLVELISHAITGAPTDLNIRWEAGAFHPSGAPLLDEALLEDPLGNVRRLGYGSSADAFERALRGFANAGDDQGRLKAVVRDAYESIEAIGKVVTRRDTDLAANREALTARANLSATMGALLREYLAFANPYRHAEPLAGQPDLTSMRVEQALYETGILLRATVSGLGPLGAERVVQTGAVDTNLSNTGNATSKGG
jgi:hypothetical protein